MKTSIFDFDLPKELIAQKPVSPRDSARLLHVGNEKPLKITGLPGEKINSCHKWLAGKNVKNCRLPLR